jgi:hypothetical protein
MFVIAEPFVIIMLSIASNLAVGRVAVWLVVVVFFVVAVELVALML